MTTNNSLSYSKKSNCFKLQLVINVIFAIALAYLLLNSNSLSTGSQSVNSKEITQWVEQNPELILASVAKMQEKKYAQKMKDAQSNISSKKDEILNDKTDPAYSPKGATVTVVEFFDYNCGYCKKAAQTVKKLLEKDNKVKVVYKEYPILGKSSNDLAKVALAVNMADPKNYRKFHEELIFSKARTEAEAIKIAGKIGINTKKLKKTLKDKAKKLDDKIAQNRQLAVSLGISGTPAFIINDQLIPGAVDLKAIEEIIKASRK